ncbi:hypothetical protein ACIA5C_31695 [Actinoplanes sp. NPDC051343]|uniref:effector-associated constant component EACC1 n=1 Tax=Actinoplanes sp. NPDC051343 TaxID=3363906 RepID=UPI0037B4428C
MSDFVQPVVLSPEDTTIKPGDWQWGEESRRLVRLLQAHDLRVRQSPRPPKPGDKGLATDIILALGASGTIGATTTVLLNWLNGRSTRSLTLTVGDGAAKRTVKLVSAGLTDSSVRAALLAALGRPAEGEGGAEAPAGPQAAEDQ